MATILIVEDDLNINNIIADALTDTPVIVIKAKNELDSKVDLFSAGADDYITKPFEIKELLARVAVQLRRNSNSHTNIIHVHKDLLLKGLS